MKPASILSWLPLAGVLGLAALAVGGLMFGLAGNHAGMRRLPDAATGSTVETLPDAGRRLSIDEAAAAPASAWSAWPGRGYIHAGRGDAVWVRVTLRNPGPQPARGVLADSEYFSDRVELWEREEAGGGWRHEVSGEGLASREKPRWGRMAAFAVEVPARGERTVYLRAEDFFAVWLRAVWWPEEGAFTAALVRDVLAEGIYYGGLAALLFYNAVLWLRLRFPDTGCYAGYLGSVATFNFVANGGFGLLGVGAGSPWTEVIATVALAASGLFLLQFARMFLELKRRVPVAETITRWLQGALAVLLLGGLAFPWMQGTGWLHWTVPAVVAVHACLLVIAVAAWRAGAGQARYFVLAFGFLFAGALPAAVSWLEADTQKRAVMGLLAGSALEMLLLSLAVADRFARIQRERTEAQEQLVEETEQRRAIQEAYADELEVEVRERTRELREAGQDKDRMIAVIGHDLRGPLTALTQSAEQAAVAPSVYPDFAYEAAQAGRRVLLLIEDLVLWARLRAGTIHPGRYPAEAFVGPVVALLRPVAVQRGIAVAVAVPADLCVTTDLVLAQTLVRNLVSNALRFARARVEVSAASVAGGVRLTVADDGPGLPPAVAARLSGDTPGSGLAEGGLGLRLCVEIGRALGIRLEVKTGAGEGTRFDFTLPAAKTEDGA
ncbi:ATP-binding protein [Opitutaceae bacterium TAV5]|nr:ATP-binding protein [Opitutaceae bacterium TAV5]